VNEDVFSYVLSKASVSISKVNTPWLMIGRERSDNEISLHLGRSLRRRESISLSLGVQGTSMADSCYRYRNHYCAGSGARGEPSSYDVTLGLRKPTPVNSSILAQRVQRAVV
jgi:hypothetical protein